MRVLITGGCGYLGGYLVRHLATYHTEKLEEIVVYDNLSRGDLAFLFGETIAGVKIRLIQRDILSRRDLLAALEGIDTVVHMAAKVSQPYTDVLLHPFDQVNNWGSANLADAIQESEVKRVIYLSSVTVYGTQPTTIDEDLIPEPVTYYGSSKLKGEKHFQRIQNKEVYILRSANVYGYSPTMRIDSVFNRFMFEAHHGGTVNRIGDGTQSRAFISLDSLSEQMCYVLFNDVIPGVYNLADKNMSINDVLEMYFELFPQLEVITVEQNAKLQSLNIEIPTKLSKLMSHSSPDILADLHQFKESFSF
jgi:UDP-glucose 4-epimerase